ncbi:uncharacterized protein LOC135931704 isoform X2 [Gordionus sp. m RMFG-2023]|uniref:uncharacterized protein LOC135931704 isoform X2 n=1 Tax=Gordionus sp. m RMFG-2023 TaxID=3053472 RepID=UPI0031FBB4AE
MIFDDQIKVMERYVDEAMEILIALKEFNYLDSTQDFYPDHEKHSCSDSAISSNGKGRKLEPEWLGFKGSFRFSGVLNNDQPTISTNTQYPNASLNKIKGLTISSFRNFLSLSRKTTHPLLISPSKSSTRTPAIGSFFEHRSSRMGRSIQDSHRRLSSRLTDYHFFRKCRDVVLRRRPWISSFESRRRSRYSDSHHATNRSFFSSTSSSSSSISLKGIDNHKEITEEGEQNEELAISMLDPCDTFSACSSHSRADYAHDNLFVRQVPTSASFVEYSEDVSSSSVAIFPHGYYLRKSHFRSAPDLYHRLLAQRPDTPPKNKVRLFAICKRVSHAAGLKSTRDIWHPTSPINTLDESCALDFPRDTNSFFKPSRRYETYDRQRFRCPDATLFSSPHSPLSDQDDSSQNRHGKRVGGVSRYVSLSLASTKDLALLRNAALVRFPQYTSARNLLIAAPSSPRSITLKSSAGAALVTRLTARLFAPVLSSASFPRGSPASLSSFVFGSALLRDGKSRGLPPIITSALQYIRSQAHDHTGVFRKAGSSARIYALRTRIEDAYRLGENTVPFYEFQIYDVADVVKQYYREIADGPIFSKEMSQLLISIFANVKGRARSCLRDLNRWSPLLAVEKREALIPLLSVLRSVSVAPGALMTAHNLAICLTPTLFHPSVFEQESITASLESRKIKTSPDRLDNLCYSGLDNEVSFGGQHVCCPGPVGTNDLRFQAGVSCLAFLIENFRQIFRVPREYLNAISVSYENVRVPALNFPEDIDKLVRIHIIDMFQKHIRKVDRFIRLSRFGHTDIKMSYKPLFRTDFGLPLHRTLGRIYPAETSYEVSLLTLFKVSTVVNCVPARLMSFIHSQKNFVQVDSSSQIADFNEDLIKLVKPRIIQIFDPVTRKSSTCIKTNLLSRNCGKWMSICFSVSSDRLYAVYNPVPADTFEIYYSDMVIAPRHNGVSSRLLYFCCIDVPGLSNEYLVDAFSKTLHKYVYDLKRRFT